MQQIRDNDEQNISKGKYAAKEKKKKRNRSRERKQRMSNDNARRCKMVYMSNIYRLTSYGEKQNINIKVFFFLLFHNAVGCGAYIVG